MLYIRASTGVSPSYSNKELRKTVPFMSTHCRNSRAITAGNWTKLRAVAKADEDSLIHFWVYTTEKHGSHSVMTGVMGCFIRMLKMWYTGSKWSFSCAYSIVMEFRRFNMIIIYLVSLLTESTLIRKQYDNRCWGYIKYISNLSKLIPKNYLLFQFKESLSA